MDLSDSPGRPACPSRASGWSSLTTPWGLPCCVRFPCVHAAGTTPAQRLGVLFRSFTQPCQPSPKGLSGRPAHRPFRGLLGVHSRYGLHTRAVTVYRDTLTRGFSHFVTSMTAPVASGWSSCRVGLAPTGKRRLSTAHTRYGHRSPDATDPLRPNVAGKVRSSILHFSQAARQTHQCKSIGNSVAHSAVIFAARITLPKFSVSAAMSLPKSSDDPGSAVTPISARRAFKRG